MPVIDALITVSPDYLGGTPVFTGTRVPVQSLFDYLQEGSLDEFLEGFPGVTREHAVAVIKLAAKRITAGTIDKAAA